MALAPMIALQATTAADPAIALEAGGDGIAFMAMSDEAMATGIPPEANGPPVEDRSDPLQRLVESMSGISSALYTPVQTDPAGRADEVQPAGTPALAVPVPSGTAATPGSGGDLSENTIPPLAGAEGAESPPPLPGQAADGDVGSDLPPAEGFFGTELASQPARGVSQAGLSTRDGAISPASAERSAEGSLRDNASPATAHAGPGKAVRLPSGDLSRDDGQAGQATGPGGLARQAEAVARLPASAVPAQEAPILQVPPPGEASARRPSEPAGARMRASDPDDLQATRAAQAPREGDPVKRVDILPALGLSGLPGSVGPIRSVEALRDAAGDPGFILVESRSALPAGTSEAPGAPEPRAGQTRQVARQIVDALVTARDAVIEIALAPEELGRLRMVVSGPDQAPHVVVWVERPEILDQLRRNGAVLGECLGDAGMAGASFEFRGDGTPDDSRRDETVPASENRAGSSAVTPASSASVTWTPMAVSARLDIRI